MAAVINFISAQRITIISHPYTPFSSSCFFLDKRTHTLHCQVAPDAHPSPAPKGPEPASHFRLLPLARFEPALWLPRFRVREHGRAAVEGVRLRAYADPGGEGRGAG